MYIIYKFYLLERKKHGFMEGKLTKKVIETGGEGWESFLRNAAV